MNKIRILFSAALCLFCMAALHFSALASEFMHDASDAGCKVIDLAAAAGSKQADAISNAVGVPGHNEARAVALSNGTLTLKNPVVPNDEVNAAAGKVLRFHVWIQGEGITAKDELWFAAPTVTLNLYDDFGTLLATSTSLFKTRGTFPWHCYYVDIEVPRNVSISGKSANTISDDLEKAMLDMADIFETDEVKLTQPGLYITLSSYSAEGKATFAALSYEVLDTAKAADRSKWLDKTSSTNAANPEYDELPALLYFGLSADQPWNFLAGNQVTPNLLTLDGLKQYLSANMTDWFHLQKGIALLPYVHLTATTLELAKFEEGWLELLQRELLAAQDPETGFWLCNGVPNLFATEAIANNCFAPATVKRSDASPIPTPGQAAGEDAELRYPARIVTTLLANRVAGTPGWNEYFLQPAGIGGEAQQNKVSLGATTAAVKLLAHAAALLSTSDPLYDEAQKAIQAAYRYAVANFLLPNRPGIWREDTASSEPSATGAFFLDLLNASAALEHRVNPALPKPTVEIVSETEKGIRVIWKNAPGKLAAVRIYAAPANVKPQFLTEKNICCFIQRDDATFGSGDPLVDARRLADAATTQWGLTPANAGCAYLAAKVNALPKRLTIGKAERAFNTEPPAVVLYTIADNVGEEDTSIVYYAAGVNAYGECTDYIPLKANNEQEL